MIARAALSTSSGVRVYVTNITTGDLQNVMVTLSGFQNFAVASSNPQAMTGTGPGTLSWNLGTLRAGETKLIKLTGTSSAVGNTSSCVSASFANTLCFGTTVVSPELRVTKTMTPQATVCDTIQAVITVTNSGTGSATNVKVVDQLPAGLTTTDGRNSIEQTIASLGGGESREIRLNLKAAKSGRYENNAQASADGIQTVNSGNVATVVTAPSVAVTCTAPQQIFIGRDARFDFAVRSTGDAPCDTVVTIPVPAGAQFVSATEGGTLQGNAVTWNLGSMAPNATRNISMVVRPAGLGTISIAGNGNCRNCPAPVTFNCSTSVTGIPALLLDGVDDPDPVQVGENVVYTLRVTNQGSAPLTNVTLVGQFEANTMQFVSATPAPSGVQGTTINFPPIATLAPGATSTYRITIKALEAGQVQFRAEAKSNEITRPLLKVETTNFYR
ncbi:DUF11 domain-containing protein [Leptolyngbya sp. 15MV]|nr:DUF11 domain-containing protein [Leptolyngbya sp. 15MV]